MGKTVTKIATNCVVSSSRIYVYIPKTVLTIEAKAFQVTGSSSTSYFYCEVDALPTGWDSQFFYNSYYSTTSYKTIEYGYVLGY